MSIRVTSVYPHEKFKGIYWAEYEDGSKRLATKNLDKGKRVYGELLVSFEGVEYRIWNPYRSKLAAAILNGLENLPLFPGSRVLYLGSAAGTTASHVSDIIEEEGVAFCVEFSPRVMREFIERCGSRSNLIPILADARFPSQYRLYVGKVDLIYADVAQPFQSKIVVDNASVFLRNRGWAILAIKAMSIDVTKEPSETYQREISHLKHHGFTVEETIHLEPYDIAHAFVLARKK